MSLPKKMPEVEVSLRLALHLIEKKLAKSDIQVAIDGAQVRTACTENFDISKFLCEKLWSKQGEDSNWRGTYSHKGMTQKIIIHSKSGCKDVVVTLVSGPKLLVECKGGPLISAKNSVEYRLLREALGQILTTESVEKNDLFAVAVPKSPKFEELSSRWQNAPLVKNSGIIILMVDCDNMVSGLPSRIVKN